MSFVSFRVKTAFIVAFVIVSSLSLFFIMGNKVPVHNYNHKLVDKQGDVTVGYLDIIEYGSYEKRDMVVLYLITYENISQELITYNLFIIAKTPGLETAHIYNNEFYNGTEMNYESKVIIKGSTLEIHFDKKNFISNSYMVGIEARAIGIEKDLTPSARSNPILMQMGIF